MRAWTLQELHSFLALIQEDRLYPLWRFFALSGVRRAEALGLRWSDVDLSTGTCSIVQARTSFGISVPRTAGSRRSLDLDPETVRVLQQWHCRQAEERLSWGTLWSNTGLVFTREDGVGYHPDGITGMFDHLQRRLNKKITAEAEKKNVEPVLLPHIRLHDLRHTHASILLANGEHPKVVSERLGHASIAFTLSTYAHVLPGLQREAVGRLAALIDG